MFRVQFDITWTLYWFNQNNVCMVLSSYGDGVWRHSHHGRRRQQHHRPRRCGGRQKHDRGRRIGPGDYWKWPCLPAESPTGTTVWLRTAAMVWAWRRQPLMLSTEHSPHRSGWTPACAVRDVVRHWHVELLGGRRPHPLTYAFLPMRTPVFSRCRQSFSWVRRAYRTAYFFIRTHLWQQKNKDAARENMEMKEQVTE